MSRLIALVIVALPIGARADADGPPPAPASSPPPASVTQLADRSADDAGIGDQAIGATLGVSGGGRVTPGGLRVSGHYLYRLADQDWFDGIATFTFGGGAAACFRDRMDTFVCDHKLADGNAAELAATVRRVFAAQGQFRPYARAGVGVSIVRFGNDNVTGVALPLHGGAGVRATVTDSVAIVGEAELVLGFGAFGHHLGFQPQLGLGVFAGAEFRLR